MMAQLMVHGRELIVRLSPLEMLGAFHSSVRVPLAQVASAEVSQAMWGQLRGMRLPGTGIPRVIALGTWRHGKGKDFAAIYRSTGVIVDLADSDWSRLLVSCTDPERVREQITGRA